MDVGKAVFKILIDDADVLALVSESGTNTRIFPSRYDFPTNVLLPYITYQVVSDEPNNTKNGVSTYDYVTVQVSIYDIRYSSMIDLAGKVRTALDYTSGTFRGVIVNKIFFQNQNETFDDSAGEQGFYGIVQDYRFNINR
mgnify:CR=1|tara:strand:+ start:327 stop:746 length:420 start_codon:yes stop_codon:yes gene_type:complete